MTVAPMFRTDNANPAPMFGADGKPLLCDTEAVCCADDNTASCADIQNPAVHDILRCDWTTPDCGWVPSNNLTCDCTTARSLSDLPQEPGAFRYIIQFTSDDCVVQHSATLTCGATRIDVSISVSTVGVGGDTQSHWIGTIEQSPLLKLDHTYSVNWTLGFNGTPCAWVPFDPGDATARFYLD